MAALRSLIVVLFVMGILTGCAAKHAAVAVPFNPAATISTMTSAVALSVSSGEKGMSGRGYLILSSPDRFRLVILSPFGTTLAELILIEDQLLYIDASRKIAYQGKVGESPDIPLLRGWRLLRWTTETVFPETEGQRQLVRKRAGGEWEFIYFDLQGLVMNKSVDGDRVRYERYTSVAGVPVPEIIEIIDRTGVTVRITLDEPEVNMVLDTDAFAPSLQGVTVLPLSQFPTS